MSTPDPPDIPPSPPELTPAEKRAAARDATAAHYRIPGKWVPPVPCPICKVENWEIGNVFSTGALRDPFPNTRGTEVYILVPVFCRNCSYAMFFNAVGMGIAEQFIPPES